MSLKSVVREPSPKELPVEIVCHGDVRVDNYAWMKDENWQKVLRDPSLLRQDIRDYLEDENRYADSILESTKPLQQELIQEMKGRIEGAESSVPTPDGDSISFSRLGSSARLQPAPLRRSLRILLAIRGWRGPPNPLPHRTSRLGRRPVVCRTGRAAAAEPAELARRQRARDGAGVLQARRQRAQPRPRAPRLRHRRQGVRAPPRHPAPPRAAIAPAGFAPDPAPREAPGAALLYGAVSLRLPHSAPKMQNMCRI